MTRHEAKILLVEDDEQLSSLVAEYLRDNGLEVAVVADGAEVLSSVQQFEPDLVILDQMLPNKDGLEICRELRPGFAGPIVFLTARSGWVDEVVGLEIGADDYLGKPVEPRLLLARVRSWLRRSEPKLASRGTDTGALEVDGRRRQVTLGGRSVELTDAEFDLLHYLSEHAGQQLTREELSREVCHVQYDSLDRTIDVRIGRLRAKLGDDPKRPRFIKSVRGVGYLFVGEEP